MRYEGIIKQSLARKNDRAMALLAVYERKLYQLTHPSFPQYLQQRWGLSRTRGYQLIHFARLRRRCLENGQPPPANERQTRQLAADGTSLPKEPHHDSYEQRLHRVRRYLAANLTKLPRGEHRRFVQDVHQALDQMERELNPQIGVTRAPERPVPRPNTGSVLGLTMDQARRLGYAR
jgi:hypothetical protein